MTIAPESAHASLTVFYDPLSYAAYDHPYEVYRQLRNHAPVYYKRGVTSGWFRDTRMCGPA
jgi:hypothetical protein